MEKINLLPHENKWKKICLASDAVEKVGINITSPNPATEILFMETLDDPNTFAQKVKNKRIDYLECSKCQLLVQGDATEFLTITGEYKDSGNGDLWMVVNGVSKGKVEPVMVTVFKPEPV